MAQEKDGNSWERIKGETSRSWLAFQDFLKAGPDRNIPDLHRKYLGRKNPPSKSKKTLNEWCSKYKWYKRAILYDSMVGRDSLIAAKDVVVADTATRLRKHLQDMEDIGTSRIGRAKAYENILNRMVGEGVLPSWMPKLEKISDIESLERAAEKPAIRGNEFVLEATGVRDTMEGLTEIE